MKRLALRITTMVVVSTLGACASINSLTRAKTLKAGEHELYAGAEYSNLLRKMDGTSTDDKTWGVDVAGRYGVTDQDEVGLRLANSLAYAAVDYKRALISGNTNLSAGAIIGYLGYTVGTQDYKQYDLGIPLYLDTQVSDSTVLIASPKFVYTVVSGMGASNYSSLVLSGGARFGKEKGVHVELGYGIPFKSGMQGMWQGNVGFFF